MPLEQSVAEKEFFYAVADCPAALGAEEVEVYFDIENERLFFFCYGCGSTWLDIFDQSEKPKTLDDVASTSIRIPTKVELRNAGITTAKRIEELINPDIRSRINLD